MAASASNPASSSDVPDVLGPGLRCVFCGINPGRVSAAANAHFANPRNDFWRLLPDLRPRAIAFVGKEDYRGLFGERPELGPRLRALLHDGSPDGPVDVSG
ncbi:MAG: hypothetical protein WCH31_01030 [Actinomycetes bacterium]